MEYVGLVLTNAGKKKGKFWFHKVLIKGPILHPVINTMIMNDALYVPVTGKIIDYVSFYALLCKNKICVKSLAEKKREQYLFIKDYDLDQLEMMKKTALIQTIKSHEQDMSELNIRRDELENTISGF